MRTFFHTRFLARLLFLALGMVPGFAFAVAPTAPSNLVVIPIGANSFELTWQDNSNNETGWEIRTALPGSVPVRLERVSSPNITNKIVIFASSFPGLTIAFQVAAFNVTSGVEQYGLSPIVKAKALSPASFFPPTLLNVVSFNDGSIALNWKDNAKSEFGYEVEMKTGTETNFVSLGTTSPGTTFNITIGSLNPTTTYAFRVRGFTSGQGNNYLYSIYSNIVTATTTAFQRPSNLQAKPEGDSSIFLTWKDESGLETSFDVEFREVGSAEFTAGTLAANTQSVNVTDLDIGKLYEFRIRAAKGDVKTDFTQSIFARIQDRFTQSLNPPIFFETDFNLPITTSRPEALTNLVVTGLPAGLSFDPVTRIITGSATVEGVKITKLIATFEAGYSIERDLVFRIIRQPSAPKVLLSFPAQTLTVKKSVKLSLTGKFSDPDTLNAQRVKTTLGDIDFILYPLATPATVQNFLTYLKGKRFTDSFFHRSIDNFVIQGGGYRYASKTGFARVLKYPAVLNEPGISNVRGTIAMAKFPDLPNSATSEFFISSNNNSENLDAQNGGFTVFGRVPNRTMSVVDAINDLPVKDYSVAITGASQLLENLPLNTTLPPPSLNPTQLVKIISILPAPILSYQVVSLNPAIATATLSGTSFLIKGVAKGSTTVNVTAIDLDGLVTTQSIPVTVN
jgi:cyclophilin family peptidyl-prolyl cis-trans isomerase